MSRVCAVCKEPLGKSSVKCSICGFLMPRCIGTVTECYKQTLADAAARYRDAHFPVRSAGIKVFCYRWDDQLEEIVQEPSKEVEIAGFPRYRIPEDILWSEETFDYLPEVETMMLSCYLEENGEKHYFDQAVPAPSSGRKIRIGVQILDRKRMRIAAGEAEEPLLGEVVYYNQGS